MKNKNINANKYIVFLLLHILFIYITHLVFTKFLLLIKYNKSTLKQLRSYVTKYKLKFKLKPCIFINLKWN